MVDKLAIALKFIGYFRDTWPDDLDDPLQLVEEDCYYQSIVPTTETARLPVDDLPPALAKAVPTASAGTISWPNGRVMIRTQIRIPAST